MHKLLCLIFSVLALIGVSRSAFSLPAFPGAEGFGTETPGGRGGRVIEVINLDDSGPGSLREALTASGPRIVVFRVAGTIELLSRIAVIEPYLTVAGQTAPGDGITLKNHVSNGKGPFRISTHDVILRYLRIRPGPSQFDGGSIDALSMYPAPYNIVVDHCSFSWATDEVLETGGAHDFTIQWSIVAEGLNNATHPEGAHSKGMHFRDANSVNISAHHNLLAHNYDRNPNVNSTGVVDLVNNVFYNATRWTEIKDSFGEPHVNIVNNYYKLGPSSGSSGYEVFYYNSTGRQPRVYVQGNIGFHRPADDLSEELIVREDSRWMIVNDRFQAPSITTVSALEAFDLVLDNAGATLPVRDAHDLRVTNDVRNGTGRIIDDPSEVGGWLVIAPATPPDDMDHDGMPDTWENDPLHKFDPANPADGPQDADNDGYTNVEEYLNGTDPGPAGGGSGNAAPVLVAIGNKTVDEETALSFTATATDADPNLTFSLVGAIPAGAGIDDTTGIFSWTPTEVQGPGDYTFAVKVCNSAALCDTETISVHVNEVDQAPVLAAIGNKTTDEGTALNFTAAATDADRPANTLIFSLEGAPAQAHSAGRQLRLRDPAIIPSPSRCVTTRRYATRNRSPFTSTKPTRRRP